MNRFTFAPAICLALALPAAAQTMDHSQHNMAGMSDDPVIMAYQMANAQMHEDMDIEYTGNADVDFVRGMIPHHQGAIDMAKIVLQYGKDPQIRQLAEDVIAAQEAEIAMMQAWLKENGQ